MTRSRSRTLAVLVGVVAVAAAACGSTDDTTTPGTGGDVRTVEVDMADNEFEPDTIGIAAGETVRFVFTNTGTVAHDAFIGDTDAQADHQTEMREADEGHDGGHDDDEAGDAITVEPGESGELTHTFDETGTLEIGCHKPGHYEDGMKMTIEVA